ncbi:acyltransferase domain-containing protein, partial [bacterium CPR1]|nr:acyltransferase domain-containing protein [bacterium CPR1]
MACLLPGADGLEAFWELLLSGQDAVVEMPPDRLDRDLYYDPRKGQRCKTYSTLGGLVPSKEPRSAGEEHDVCHRLFCDVARQALENGGLTDLKGRAVGVFVGHSAGSARPGERAVSVLADQIYRSLEQIPAFQHLPQATREAILHETAERLRAGRPRPGEDGGPWLEARWSAELLAAELGLTGPNLVVDSACASSLVALALGALALERGDIELAVVGGASYAKSDSLLLFSQAQSCSARGTRPFDDEADGLIGSEGYVALVLKTEARARQDGDKILAVIRGVGLSSDGRGRHLWAPQPEGQMAALQRAYGDILSPGDIQYIEAHATSTQVGDATELESLATFFGPHVQEKLPLGSVKSNLGHTLETAGLAAVLKVILAMERGLIPPSANVKQKNSAIDWDSLPLTIATEPREWPRPADAPRRAGVSAFGIGGLNVHLVVEEPGAPLPVPDRIPEEPIAIVGRGLVVPGAHDLEAFRKLLSSGQSQVREAPEHRWPGRVGLGAVVPHNRGGYITDYQYDYLKHRVPPKQIAMANPLQFMLLDATEQALTEAGKVDRCGTTVVVGTQFGGEFGNKLVAGLRFPEIERNLRQALERHQVDPDTVLPGFEELFFELYNAPLDETGSFTSSTLASRITKTFDFEGGAMAVEAGDCSGLVGLGIGAALLRGRVCQAVVCAGAQHSLDLPAYELMHRRGAFSDPDYTPGEGVGVVVLKRLKDARRDGNPVLGVLLGEGTRYAHRAPEEATILASCRALEVSGLSPEQILAVEPGSAMPAIRVQQERGLRQSFAGQTARRTQLTAQVGHMGAAEGIVRVIQATLEPREGVEAHHAVSESGLASQILLGAPPAAPRPDQLKSKLRLGALTLPELVAKLQQSGAGTQAPFSSQDVYRLVLLSKNPAEMPAKLDLARTKLEHRALLEEQGIFLGQVTPGRVAFMFSGQGSQYHGMLNDLVERSPAAREQMEEADRLLRAAGLPTFEELAWADTDRLDEDPVTTQVAVLIADMLVFAALLEEGFEPDCVAGHSFGEIPAMVAARVLTLEAAIRVTRERAQALLAASPDGGLLSVQASPEIVRELMVGHPLHLTHHNAPEQTVVGGRLKDLETFAVVLSEHKLKSRWLKVPGALHTPLVKAAQEPLRQALARETLLPPTRLFYSNVTNDRVFEPEKFVENLVAQLTDPIAYPKLLRKMRQDGVTVFLEVGPNQVLTGLHRQILEDAVVVASDHPRRGAHEQLERARAALEVVGCLSSQRPSARENTLGGEIT